MLLISVVYHALVLWLYRPVVCVCYACVRARFRMLVILILPLYVGVVFALSNFSAV